MTKYDGYLVGQAAPYGRPPVAFVGQVEASSPSKAQRKVAELADEDDVAEIGERGMAEYPEELEDVVRVYPANYRTGI